jgi:hypothetical protein
MIIGTWECAESNEDGSVTVSVEKYMPDGTFTTKNKMAVRAGMVELDGEGKYIIEDDIFKIQGLVLKYGGEKIGSGDDERKILKLTDDELVFELWNGNKTTYKRK